MGIIGIYIFFFCGVMIFIHCNKTRIKISGQFEHVKTIGKLVSLTISNIERTKIEEYCWIYYSNINNRLIYKARIYFVTDYYFESFESFSNLSNDDSTIRVKIIFKKVWSWSYRVIIASRSVVWYAFRNKNSTSRRIQISKFLYRRIKKKFHKLLKKNILLNY